MAVEIIRSSPGLIYSREVVATLPTFKEAIAYARVTYDVYFLEEDADHEDCADFITRSSEIFAIQPVGFKITN